MEFIETKIFSKLLPLYLSDDEFYEVEQFLNEHPDAGNEIRDSGGIRKLRWAFHGQGKRSGLRIIYYWIINREKIYLLYLYPKNRTEDLTIKQLKQLSGIGEIELKNERK